MKTKAFHLFTLAVFLLLILPALLQRGIFMDGLLYTCVARNLSEGLGTFWEPYFSSTWIKNGNPGFHEHPPLVFGIQALFFSLLGNSIYVERFYSLLSAFTTAFLIYKIWIAVLAGEKSYQNLAWLPVFCWIIIPVCFWSYQNNMQENTMGIFTLLATFFALHYFRFNQWSMLLAAGISIFAASLSKGLPGLFPLAIPCLWYCCTRQQSWIKMIQTSMVLILIPSLLYALLLLYEPARQSLSFYLEYRVLGRIEQAPTVDHRWYTLWRLFQELLPVLILGLLALGIARFKKTPLWPQPSMLSLAFFFLALGAAGTLPLLLTKVQKGFYMVPALPYFGLGLAMLMIEPWRSLVAFVNQAKRRRQGLSIFSLVLIALVAFLSFKAIPTFKKNEALIQDIEIMGQHIPTHTTIGIDKNLQQNWAMHCYFMRYFFISLDQKENNQNFHLRSSPQKLAGYELLELPLSNFYLHQKQTDIEKNSNSD